MHALADWLLALAAFVGHFSIAVWLFNRLHALAWPRTAIKILERCLLAVAALVVAAVLGRWLMTGQSPILPAAGPWSIAQWVGVIYAGACWLAAAAVLPLW